MIPTSRPGTRILLKLDNCNVNYVEYLQNIGSIFLEYLQKILNICKQVWRDITYLVSDIFAQYSNPLKSRPALHFFLPRKLSKACTFPTAFRSCTLYSLVLFLRISSFLNCVSRLLFLRFQHKPKIFVLPNLVQKSQGAQQREASGSKSNIFFLILNQTLILVLVLV